MNNKYKESNLIELKSSVEDSLIYEIVAFLNSYMGGTIYIGVNDDGTIIELNEKERDLYESKIINWIRDETIYPNCSEYVQLSYNEDNVLVISITPGSRKPYYHKTKGLKSSGVYIRYGRNKTQASPEEISRMLLESSDTTFESLVSIKQNLTFETLHAKFRILNLNFYDFKMITSGFIDVESNQYTNLAFWFSDQYDVDTKVAVYQGLDRAIFRSKQEFSGSIIEQIDGVMKYFDLCNEVKIIIDGNPIRKEIFSYNKIAAREAILNCYCHRDYSRKSNIKIEFFDDRCEIMSPGGFYGGLTLEKALEGYQSFRNENLVKLLFKLGYIENYASGISRIFNVYKNEEIKPRVDTSLIGFKMIFPNKNYDVLKEMKRIELTKVTEKVIEKVTEKEIDIINLLMMNPEYTLSQMAMKLGVSRKTIASRMKSLKEKGFIERYGSDKKGYWQINKELLFEE